MMIDIVRTCDADSRAAQGEPSKEKLLTSTVQHIEDVQKGLAYFASLLVEAGTKHDHTKISGIDDFFELYSGGLKGEEFKQGDWFKLHITERHHLNDRCPDDVNLIDVLERVADITMAGMGRSGAIYSDSLDEEILLKAYKNTIKLLCDNVTVLEEKP